MRYVVIRSITPISNERSLRLAYKQVSGDDDDDDVMVMVMMMM